jgi:hypothetical protein
MSRLAALLRPDGRAALTAGSPTARVRGLSRIQLYDHDFEARELPGAHIPAIELPVSS